MKRRTRKLWRALDNQMILTVEALEIIKLAYSQSTHDTASDEGRTEPHPAPSVHKPIQHIEPESQLEHYR